MIIRHYYHIYAGGAWAGPAREHVAALGRARFRGDIVTGLTGPEPDRDVARDLTGQRMYLWDLPVPVRWIEADEGYEQVTLSQIHADVHRIPGDYAVLYAHTKGARDNSDWNAAWRRSMTRHVVSGWEHCVKLLEGGGTDAVGCHWLTREEHHDPPDRIVTTPFFGGNFWWARAAYLRTLPPPGTEHRYQAEEWIGLGSPRVHDLLPGWPSPELCAGPEQGGAS